MYFLKSISEHRQITQFVVRQYSKTMRLVLGSFLGCMAAILQSAGAFTGIGYLISPFATLPILICSILSFPIGVMSYILTILLLLLLQPSELLVFTFTTGLVGLSIGVSFHFFKKRISIISVGAIMLAVGINSLLYVIQFPILGPAVSNSFSAIMVGSIIFFSYLYCWFWFEVSLMALKRVKRIIFS